MGEINKSSKDLGVAEFQEREKDFYRNLIQAASDELMVKLSDILGYDLQYPLHLHEGTKMGGEMADGYVSLRLVESVDSYLKIYNCINHILLHELAHSDTNFDNSFKPSKRNGGEKRPVNRGGLKKKQVV